MAGWDVRYLGHATLWLSSWRGRWQVDDPMQAKRPTLGQRVVEVNVERVRSEHVLLVHTWTAAFENAHGFGLGVIGVGVEHAVPGHAVEQGPKKSARLGVESESTLI